MFPHVFPHSATPFYEPLHLQPTRPALPFDTGAQPISLTISSKCTSPRWRGLKMPFTAESLAMIKSDMHARAIVDAMADAFASHLEERFANAGDSAKLIFSFQSGQQDFTAHCDIQGSGIANVTITPNATLAEPPSIRPFTLRLDRSAHKRPASGSPPGSPGTAARAATLRRLMKGRSVPQTPPPIGQPRFGAIDPELFAAPYSHTGLLQQESNLMETPGAADDVFGTQGSAPATRNAVFHSLHHFSLPEEASTPHHSRGQPPAASAPLQAHHGADFLFAASLAAETGEGAGTVGSAVNANEPAALAPQGEELDVRLIKQSDIDFVEGLGEGIWSMACQLAGQDGLPPGITRTEGGNRYNARLLSEVRSFRSTPERPSLTAKALAIAFRLQVQQFKSMPHPDEPKIKRLPPGVWEQALELSMADSLPVGVVKKGKGFRANLANGNSVYFGENKHRTYDEAKQMAIASRLADGRPRRLTGDETLIEEFREAGV